MLERNPERRRSERLAVQVPVVVRGIDATGREFFDRARLVSIDQHGARLRSRLALALGTEVEVQLLPEEEARHLRVIWRGEPGSLLDGIVGLEFARSEESWNLEAMRAYWNSGNHFAGVP